MHKRFLILLLLINLPLLLSAQSLRVEIDELKNNLNQFKIIDVRKEEAFLKGHIKNAVNLPSLLTYNDLSVNGKVAAPNKIQAVLRNIGIQTNDNIVVYDEGAFFDASRVFWTLEVYGFKNVKILNAGYKEWLDKKFPTSTKPIDVTPSNYIAKINNDRVSTKFTTQLATKNPNQIVIDARDYDSFIGKKSIAKRFGHIPKAIHIPAAHNLSTDEQHKKMKDTSALKDLYKDVDKTKKIVIYCKIGKVASTNYFALRELGFNVSNYDASWKEWGNDITLPIVNKSKGE